MSVLATVERETLEQPGHPKFGQRRSLHGSDHDAPPHGMFSPDELTMIAMFADGLCINTIARRMSMSDRTVRRRSRLMCDRLRVNSMIQVVAWAARRRLI